MPLSIARLLRLYLHSATAIDHHVEHGALAGLMDLVPHHAVQPPKNMPLSPAKIAIFGRNHETAGGACRLMDHIPSTFTAWLSSPRFTWAYPR